MGKAFNVRVDRVQHNRLKVLAARMDLQISAIIRSAVNNFLEKHEPQFEAGAKKDAEQ